MMMEGTINQKKWEGGAGGEDWKIILQEPLVLQFVRIHKNLWVCWNREWEIYSAATDCDWAVDGIFEGLLSQYLLKFHDKYPENVAPSTIKTIERMDKIIRTVEYK